MTGEVSCKDEARIGQKNGLVRQWARRGTRPTQPADQRYDNAYLFGAICPARGVGAALALPYADTDMMQLHLDEISRNVAEGAHAVLLLDRAGWHTTGKLDVPENITPIFLPSRAPELNPVENVWQYLRQNWLSNTVFENYDAISTPHATHGTNSPPSPKPITSIGMRDWAHVGRRCGLRRMAKAHRPARTDHINRNAKMGPHRSALMTVGITFAVKRSCASVRRWRQELEAGATCSPMVRKEMGRAATTAWLILRLIGRASSSNSGKSVPSAQPLAGPRPFAPKGRHVCTSSARISAMGDNSKELSPRRKRSMIASPAKASGHIGVAVCQ